MAFNVNYSKAQQGDGIKPEGYYEVIIHRAEEKTTPNGKRKISFRLIIRNDVEQGYKNGYIFHDIWAKTPEKLTPDDEAVGGYNFAQLMAVAEAAKLPQDKEYANLAALLSDMVDKPICVNLYHDTYNGKTNEKVKGIYPTKFPEVKHKQKTSAAAGTYAAKPAAQFAAAPAAPAEAASEADDDYPF